jgi:hypothetical protein
MRTFLLATTVLVLGSGAAPAQTVITPGSGPLTDAAGNAWLITADGSIRENGQWTPGGGGTAALAIVNGTVYGLDSGSGPVNPGGWFVLSGNGRSWAPSAAPAASTASPALSTPAPAPSSRTAATSTVPAAAPATPASTAMTTAQFIDTIGVNTHIATGVADYENAATDLADMQYLGIVNARDQYNPANQGVYASLGRAGIKFDLVTYTGGAVTTADLQSELASLNQMSAAAPGMIAALEGPNEINNWPITYNGQTSLDSAVAYQQSLYALAHADSSLPGVQVYYFTGYGMGGNAQGPNPATTPGLANFDTAHPYPQNGKPPLEGLMNSGGALNPLRANALSNAGPGAPAVYTETGYSMTASGNTLAAIGDVELLLDDAQQGIAKTYLYELEQEAAGSGDGTGGGLGLFNGTAPTPAATAIHNLTTILGNGGGGSGVAAQYSITGLPASTGHSLTLTGANGAIYIAIWNEDWSGATAPVTVSLDAPAAVSVYDPMQSASPVQTLAGASSVPLNLTADPMIVEINGPANACAALPGGAATGGFTTANGRIIAPDGSVFIAKGINTMEQQVSSATLKSVFPGINFVRYAVYDYAGAASLAGYVSDLTSAGIVIELENHNNGAGNAGGSQGTVFTGAALAREQAWYSSVAAAFKANPYVWFGTNNEPSESPSAAALSAWQGQTYQTIRGAGNNSPVMVEMNCRNKPVMTCGQGYTASVYAAMTNIIWDIHYYGWLSDYSTDQAVVSQNLAQEIAATQRITGGNGTVPVLIGEYGNSTTGQAIDPNAQQVLTAVEQSGVGSAAWAWGPGNPGDGLTTGGNGLSSYGQDIAGYIALVANAPASIWSPNCGGAPTTAAAAALPAATAAPAATASPAAAAVLAAGAAQIAHGAALVAAQGNGQ